MKKKFNEPINRVSERVKQREEAYELGLQISEEKRQQRYNETLSVYKPHEDTTIPSRRSDNANLVKIIWQLKLRTTLLSNVINQILYKWPEDKESVLDILEKNRIKYENSAPKEFLNLIETKDILYDKVINDPIFNLSDKPFPSRVKSSKIGGNVL